MAEWCGESTGDKYKGMTLCCSKQLRKYTQSQGAGGRARGLPGRHQRGRLH